MNVNNLLGKKITRRQFNKTLAYAGAGLAASGMGVGNVLGAKKTEVVSWSPTGGRWEIPSRAVKPDFEKAFPDIKVKIIATPIGEMSAKMGVVLGAKSSAYDTIYGDYAPLYPFIIGGYLEPIDPYLDEDPAFRDDIVNDIPKNVLDTYRDKTGKLYGLPPDSNCQMQYYRAEVFDKYGIKLPKTWDECIEAAKELTGGDQYGFTCSLRRGVYTTYGWKPVFFSHGGSLFDKQEKGYYNPTLLTDAGVKATNVLKELVKYGAPGTLNAVDDETNEHLVRGIAVYGPIQWGGSVMTDPKYCQFAEHMRVGVVPASPGHNPTPTMGGLGFVIPINAKRKKEVWKWIKYCNSKEIQKKWVENTGQPSRTSSLKNYQNLQPYFAGLMESLPVAKRTLALAEVWGVYEAIGTELASALVGDKDVEAALKGAEKAVDDIIVKAGYRG
jgi:ABC-type glycerol-3-phosphate transport system substrate-binding protein